MIIQPRMRGFICVTTHPVGCGANVRQQIEYVKANGAISQGPRKVLVIGASTGYGLAARITAAFASGADTLGVFFERPGTEGKVEAIQEVLDGGGQAYWVCPLIEAQDQLELAVTGTNLLMAHREHPFGQRMDRRFMGHVTFRY